MKTVTIILCAFFAALTAVLGQIVIPAGPVPINLATFSVLSSGTLLGAKRGALSQTIYILLGVAGVPVFTMFRSGPGILAGPTGGYIAGYVLAAFVAGFISQRSNGSPRILILAMTAGYFAYTVPGTFWYMFSTKIGIAEALMICVVPFIIGDALKIAAAAFLTLRLRPVLKQLEATHNTR